MTDGFERVEDAARRSRLIGGLAGGASVARASWRSSRVSAALQPALTDFGAQSSTARIRWAAVVLTAAALTHLALRSMLSPTIAPAIPAFFVAGIAAVGAVVAWQAPAFDRALADSRVRRAINRLFR
jgi:hypothetical protein